MGMPFPAKDEFTVEAIKNKFNKRRSLVQIKNLIFHLII